MVRLALTQCIRQRPDITYTASSGMVSGTHYVALKCNVIEIGAMYPNEGWSRIGSCAAHPTDVLNPIVACRSRQPGPAAPMQMCVSTRSWSALQSAQM